MPPLSYALLDWRQGNQPYSRYFEDIYFCGEDGGIAESRYVFLEGNRLPERFLVKHAYKIAETGFGTGLNFFLTAQQFMEHAPRYAILHFTSVEKYPLSPADMKRFTASHPFISQLPFTEDFLKQYQPKEEGRYSIALLEGRIRLELFCMDVLTALDALPQGIDSWYLDGFAPSKNMDMWQPVLFETMARCSAPGAGFATFTAAGKISRGLKEAGFIVQKTKGFGRKRERIKGYFPAPSPSLKWKEKPWFLPPASIGSKENQAVVIGGGLAGSSTAYQLARRGWQVTLIERHGKLAAEASGNPLGVVMPVLASKGDKIGKFYTQAYLYALHQFRYLASDNWRQCGVLFFPEARSAKQNPLEGCIPIEYILMCRQKEASAIAGIKLKSDAIFFPDAGYINPAALCEAYVHAGGKNIEVLFYEEAIDLKKEGERWLISDNKGKEIAAAPVVVIANALDAVRFSFTGWLPLRSIRGQLTYLPESEALASLKTVLCGERYISPAVDGRHVVGASFQVGDKEQSPRARDHEKNLEALAKILPAVSAYVEKSGALGGRVAFRAASPDRRPIVGGVPVKEAFLRQYADIWHGKHYKEYEAPPYHKGLYVNVGHGARGLVSTPLTAALIAAQVVGEAVPELEAVARLLHPARFLCEGLKPTK